MIKIPFKNGEAPYLNEDNLNLLQDYIEQAIRTEGGGGGDTLPIGAVVELASNTVPNNWLLCNGQAVSRTYYADLFAAIGTTWGAGDGSTTFNLPNRAGLIAIGAGTHTDTNGDSKTFVLGQEYGEYEHTLTRQEMPSHSHKVTTVGINSGAYGYNVSSLPIGSEQNEYTQNTGGDQGHNNIQPSIATNFIIKARQSAGVSASVIQEDGTPNETDVYSSEAVQKMFGKQELFLYKESEISLAEQYRAITDWLPRYQLGSELSVSNGVITIGENIKTIKITYNLRMYNTTGNSIFYCYIQKNNQNIPGTWLTETINQDCYRNPTKTVIIEVNEGDTIKLTVYGGTTTKLFANDSTMLIEKIA